MSALESGQQQLKWTTTAEHKTLLLGRGYPFNMRMPFVRSQLLIKLRFQHMQPLGCLRMVVFVNLEMTSQENIN